MRLFTFLKFFQKPAPQYSLGAQPSGPDSRDIHIATVQSPVAIPLTFKTNLNMFPILDQGNKGTCVWQSLRILRQYYHYKKTGDIQFFSARSGYILSKQQDGIPDTQGTTPRSAAKVITTAGIATNTQVPDDNTLPYDQYIKYPLPTDQMVANRLSGYVSVPLDFQSIKQAIYQNGVVTGINYVESKWFSGIIQNFLSQYIIGSHQTIWYGYDAEGIYARNSWGDGWTAVLAKVLGFPDGDFYFKWSDYSDKTFEVYAYMDIPQPILDHVKSLSYHFNNTMRYGQTSPDVLQLQNRLDKEGFWQAGIAKTGFYGAVTSGAVLAYQVAHKVDSIQNLEAIAGQICGPKTIRSLNGEVGLDLVHAIIQTESCGNDYALGDTNLKDHAYGCMQIRQGVVDQINIKLGTNYVSKDCLGNRDLSLKIWDTYWTIFTQMTTDEDKAKAWNGGPAWKQLYGKMGYEKYSQNIDKYWATVRSYMQGSN